MLPNHQFYFVKYRWRRRATDSWNHENKLVGEHPLHWLVSFMQKYPERIVLDFYKEITPQMFEKYKDVLD